MRTPLAPNPPHPPPVLPADGTGQDRPGMALPLVAVGICAVVGVAAGWTLLLGPLATPWPTLVVLAVMAIGACAGVVATIHARPSHDTHHHVSTPPGVGYDRDQDDPTEWS